MVGGVVFVAQHGLWAGTIEGGAQVPAGTATELARQRHATDEAAVAVDRHFGQLRTECIEQSVQRPHADLTTQGVERQGDIGQQGAGVKASGDDELVGLGQHLTLGIEGLPAVAALTQRMHRRGPTHLNARRGQLRGHQLARAQPGGHGMPQGWRLLGQAGSGDLFEGGGRSPFVALLGPGLARRQGALTFHAVLQHARPGPVAARLQQFGAALQGGSHTGAGDARKHAVVGRNMRGRQAGGQARGARADTAAGIEHRHRPAAPRQAAGHSRARQTGAQHQGDALAVGARPCARMVV